MEERWCEAVSARNSTALLELRGSKTFAKDLEQVARKCQSQVRGRAPVSSMRSHALCHTRWPGDRSCLSPGWWHGLAVTEQLFSKYLHPTNTQSSEGTSLEVG